MRRPVLNDGLMYLALSEHDVLRAHATLIGNGGSWETAVHFLRHLLDDVVVELGAAKLIPAAILRTQLAPHPCAGGVRVLQLVLVLGGIGRLGYGSVRLGNFAALTAQA